MSIGRQGGKRRGKTVRLTRNHTVGRCTKDVIIRLYTKLPPYKKTGIKTASRYGCRRTERLGAKEALSLQLNRLAFAAKGFRICFWCGDVFAQLAHFGFSF